MILQLTCRASVLPLLVMLCASYPFTSAFVFVKPSDFRSAAPVIAKGRCVHTDGKSDGYERQWNASPIAIASTLMILLSPLASYADNQQPCMSPRVVGDWPSSSIVMSISTADLSSISSSSITELGLKPATEDKPQIKLDSISDEQTAQQTISRKDNARKPILQGLVYFPERAPTGQAVEVPGQKLDYYSDVLVLTAVSADDPKGPILAGAKFPVSSVRFPFSFQMYKENLLTSRPGVQEAWESLEEKGDVIVRANICPGDAESFPCTAKETKKYSEGVAKLITNLPGLKEGESIRAPASLPL